MESRAPALTGATGLDPASFAEVFGQIQAELANIVLGQEEAIRAVVIALVAGGHVLLEGPPGIGKTLLARTLARTLGVEFRRIQFTPDLMPSDVTGGNVYNQRSNEFEFRAGPIFTQLLLADEINRAPAKTQAALLEALSDRQVTVDGVTRPLPRPFFTLATQNPIESEGTYPLPEAQVDRFLMKVLVGHPEESVEVRLLDEYMSGFDASNLEAANVRTVADGATIEQMRLFARTIRVDPSIRAYIVQLVSRTRHHPWVDLGASPRASVALLLSTQVAAAGEGRAFVVPDDVKELARPVLRHRFLLQPDAELEGATPDRVIDALLQETPVPAGESR